MSQVFVVDDTVRVFDVGNGRHSVFNTDGVFVRSTGNAPWPQNFVRVGNTYALSAMIRSPEQFAQPVHLFDIQTGAIVRSLRGSSGPVSAADLPRLQRVIAPGVDGRLWAAAIRHYTIEDWDLTGVLRHRFTRDVDWFTSPDFSRPQHERPPESGIQAVYQDESGLLWVLTNVPATNWRRAYEQSTQQGPYGPVPLWHLLYDTVIDVIDPVRRQLVASQRVDEYLRGFVSGHAFGYEEDSLGIGSIPIWSLRLNR